jgi:hypothetical protein
VISWRACLILAWVLTASATVAFAQEYPRWFLRQGDIPCAFKGVGYGQPGWYVDTTGGPAFRDAVKNAIVYHSCTIKGSESFWTAEFGTMVMGSTVVEEYDTTAAEENTVGLRVLDQFRSPKCQLVLAGETGCMMSPADRAPVNVRAIPRPAWVEQPPSSPTHFYAVGMSAEFFYESSSWELAEFTARRELARNVSTGVRGVQRVSTVGEEHRDATLSCQLQDVQVMERWKDPIKRIHYVLVRMLKANGTH